MFTDNILVEVLSIPPLLPRPTGSSPLDRKTSSYRKILTDAWMDLLPVLGQSNPAFQTAYAAANAADGAGHDIDSAFNSWVG